MKVAAYKSGVKVPIKGVNNPGSVVLEVVLDDDRTVQLAVDNDGTVQLRGWGNTPAKVGNWNNLNVIASIKKEEPSHCEKCYCPLNDGPENLRCCCE